MAKSSTSFKPGNKCFNLERLKGTTVYWTDEKINELIASLEIWMQKNESISMAGWRGEESLIKQTVDYLKEKSPVFRASYEIARLIVANRIVEKTGNGGVHSSVLNMLMPIYDPEVKEHQIEMIKEKSNAESAANPLSLDQMRKIQQHNPKLFDEIMKILTEN